MKNFLSRLKDDFSRLEISPDDASLFIDFMDDYLHSWNLTKTMMLKNLRDFVLIDTKEFEDAVTWLNERGIPMDTIKEIFKGNASGAYRVSKEKLERIVKYMQDFIGGENAKNDVDSMMFKNPVDFVQIDTKEFEDVVTWFNEERGILMEAIKEVFKRNIKAAKLANKDKLEHVAKYMQNFIGGENAKNDVDAMMFKNPVDFVQIDTKELEDAVTWLNEERGIPMDTIKKIFKGSIEAAKLANKDKLEQIAKYMQDFFGGENAKKDVDSMMSQNLGAFVQIDTKELEDAVTWFNKERGIPMDAIKKVFKGSIEAASLVNKDKLEHVAKHIQTFFGGDSAKEDVNSMMLQNLGDFAQIDTKEFEDTVTWFNKERGIPMDIIKETFKGNASGVYQVSKEKLEHVAKYMQDFIGGENAKKDVDSMMLQNPRAFVLIDTEEFEDAVTWFKERGILEETIKEIFKGNVSAARLVNKDKLEHVAKHMQKFFGGDNVKNDVDSMMLKNPESFVQIDTEEFEDAVTWLNEERGILMDIIKEAFKKNAGGVYRVSKEKLEHVAKYMQDFIGAENAKEDVDSMMLKNPSDFVQIDTSEFGEAVTWLIEERNIPESLIKEAFRKNVRAAMIISKAKLETLTLEMDNFFSGKEIDLDSLLEKITEEECRTLTNILCP